jgi:hypothetical protein
MGLDITAYRKLVEQPDAELDEDGHPVGDMVRFTENTDFPGRFAGLKEQTTYSYQDAFGFRAGSYGGYNSWRRSLAQMVGYTDREAWDGQAEGKPFVELVNFSDCEGTIGPVVSAKLAKDFAEWDERAKQFSSDVFWFSDLYAKWRVAFDMAADGGAVDFH